MTLIYQNEICLSASMHKKEQAIIPSFQKILGCRLIQAPINTDLLGTFTGEVERKLSPLECAREKCRRALITQDAHLAIASEGSFGPHPWMPFVQCDQEILFFTDQKLGFELFLSKVSLKTNYSGKSIDNLENLFGFAKEVVFPSHGLIVRPNVRDDQSPIYKGIVSVEDLEVAFCKCCAASSDKKAWVETDMRAHMNPTRMEVIAELAQKMAERLSSRCPSCQIPGWGLVKQIVGLKCEVCNSPTQQLEFEVYGCCKCDFQEFVKINEGRADPRFCSFCNP